MSLSHRFNAALTICLLLSGCASMPMADTGDVYDPFEKENRVLFDATFRLDRAVIRRVAIAYRDVVPSGVRDSIRNFLNNLGSPVVFANDVLQGDVDGAGTTLFRLGVNTTIGIGGLFDPANGWGYPRHTSDFGVTLGTYGVGEGPYLFIPILGPSNIRDLSGYGVDFLFDPFTYYPLRENFWWQSAGRDWTILICGRATSKHWMRLKKLHWIFMLPCAVFIIRNVSLRSGMECLKFRICRIFEWGRHDGAGHERNRRTFANLELGQS